jgi:group I intron endonuclease
LNLYIRFKNYFNISYLERETKKNNSLIYRALLKYGYSSFKLDILEYCDLVVVIEKEQYYLDNLKLEYNTLKVARYLPGFKHSAATIDRISAAKLVRDRDEAIK